MQEGNRRCFGHRTSGFSKRRENLLYISAPTYPLFSSKIEENHLAFLLKDRIYVSDAIEVEGFEQ